MFPSAMRDLLRPLVFVSALALPALPAQVEWVPARAMPTEASMVLDEARECVVLAGDAIPRETDFVTWEWDHADWRDCTAAGSPAAWMTSRLVYEPARRQVLRVASQTSGTNVIETWAYDGSVWTRLQPPVQPPPRQFFALAHDAARQRTVLFGGFGANQRLNDTWEFDGTTWTLRAAGVTPPARFWSAMAYDEARQQIVLFGGIDQNLTWLADTWVLDGNGWQQVATSVLPPNAEHAMAFDRASRRVVMFGGQTADTWLWDGNDWSQAAVTHSPPARPRPAMATDPAGGVFLYGGSFQRSDLWRFVNGNWYLYHDHRHMREQAVHQKLFYDGVRERVLWLGNGIGSAGAMEMWEYDGRYWRILPTQGPRPLLSADSALAFDPVRAATVLFGGASSLTATDETWSWDGTAWTRLTPAVRPPGRLRHAMAFDPSGQRLLLFGGVDSVTSPQSLFGDTWSFDGQSWQQLSPTVAPSPRHSHAMATDPVRGRVLLFGGYQSSFFSNPSDETWEFANGTWRLLSPAVSPPATAQGPLAFDGKRDRLLLQGRTGQDLSRTWEFDGASWSLLPAPVVDSHLPPQLVYDPRTDRTLLKGRFAAFFHHDVLELAREPRASAQSYGNGCSRSGPPPRLSTSAVPYFGNLAFQVEVTGAPHAITLLVLGLAPGNLPIQGCTLLVAPPFDLRARLANGHGVAAFHQQVPMLPELRGVPLYFQAGQFDPRLGFFDYSRGLELVLGD